jgi:hypothetical protein
VNTSSITDPKDVLGAACFELMVTRAAAQSSDWNAHAATAKWMMGARRASDLAESPRASTNWRRRRRTTCRFP